MSCWERAWRMTSPFVRRDDPPPVGHRQPRTPRAHRARSHRARSVGGCAGGERRGAGALAPGRLLTRRAARRPPANRVRTRPRRSRPRCPRGGGGPRGAGCRALSHGGLRGLGRRGTDAVYGRLPRAGTHVRGRGAACARRARAAGPRRRAPRGCPATARVGGPLGLASRPGNGGLLERARVALSLLLGTLAACHGDRTRAAPRPVPGEGAPRVTVEVLNAGARPGLARVATRLLREAGIDVVSFGNASGDAGPLDSTRIVVRRGPAE